jgi:branched-chain amino acid transport system substrate-binding protein
MRRAGQGLIVALMVALMVLGLGWAQQTVVIGWSGAVTGPTSDAGQFVVQGVEDYCRYANDEGLAEGLTFRCLTRDDQYNNDNTVRNFEAFMDEGMVAFISYATGATLQLKLNAVEEEIAVISASLHVGVIDPPDNEYMFLPISTYSEQVLALMEWIADNHEGDTPRVAILSHPSPFGRAPVEDANNAAALLGIEIVDVQETGEGIDYTAMLQRWDASGVEYVISQNVQSPVAAMLSAAQALGLKERMTFMGAHYTGSETLISLAGDAAEGFLWATSFYLESEDTPGMALQREIGERYGRNEATIADVNYTTGLLQGAIYVEAARRAAETGEVTQESMFEALTGMNEAAQGTVDPGFAVGPVSFSETDRIGVDALRLFEVQEGAFVPITEPFNSRTFPEVHPLD